VTRLQVRDFEPADLDFAARLLAARFERAGENPAALGPTAPDTESCRASLESLASARHARGVVAARGVELIGFLLAERVLTPPDSAQSYFNPAFSAASPLHGHAVAAAEDPALVYRTLYAALAGDFVADGFLEHGIGVLAGERELHEAWVALGFGRSASLAFRGVEPLAQPTRSDLEIRQATEKELPEVFALLAEQRAFHARSPMFLPDLRILHEPQENLVRSLLEQPRCPTFVAYREGRALGMQLFAPLSFISWPLRDDATVYLFQGVVSEHERGAKVGATLLQHSLAWMRRENVRRCGLHYLSANPSGVPFWTSHGFRPAEHFLHRTVDARMAWSAP
jgi:GNAT superfamily N-acetyltransferase